MTNKTLPVMVKCEYRDRINSETGICPVECPYDKKRVEDDGTVLMPDKGNLVCATNGYRELSLEEISPLNIFAGLMRKFTPQ